MAIQYRNTLPVYFLHSSDVTSHMKLDLMEVNYKKAEPWQVTLLDTVETTMTGGRLKRVREYLDGDSFCFSCALGWPM